MVTALMHAALLHPEAHAGDQGQLHQRPGQVQQAGVRPPTPLSGSFINVACALPTLQRLPIPFCMLEKDGWDTIRTKADLFRIERRCLHSLSAITDYVAVCIAACIASTNLLNACTRRQAMDVIMARVEALSAPLRAEADCERVRGEGVGKDSVEKLKEIVRTGAFRRSATLARDPHHQAIKLVRPPRLHRALAC